MKRTIISIGMILFICVFWPMTVRANQTGQLMIAQGNVEVKTAASASSETIVTYADGEAVFVVGEKNGWYEVIYQDKTGYVVKSSLKKITMGDLPEQKSLSVTTQATEAGNGGSIFEMESTGVMQAPGVEGSWESFGGQAGYQAAFWGEEISQEEAGYQLFIAALNEEMAAIEAESKILVEEVERQREEKKSGTVWAVIIGVLVVGIFATGLISASKSGKEEGKQEEKKKENQEDEQLEIIDLDKES